MCVCVCACVCVRVSFCFCISIIIIIILRLAKGFYTAAWILISPFLWSETSTDSAKKNGKHYGQTWQTCKLKLPYSRGQNWNTGEYLRPGASNNWNHYLVTDFKVGQVFRVWITFRQTFHSDSTEVVVLFASTCLFKRSNARSALSKWWANVMGASTNVRWNGDYQKYWFKSEC